MSEKEYLSSRLKELILNLDDQGVIKATQDAIAQGISVREILDMLAEGMTEVGKRFDQREIYLPEVLLAADAMKGAMDILLPLLPKDHVGSAGKVVIGCGYGDIHDIGKNIVAAVLRANGFTVYDLGPDVPPETFLAKAQEVDADVVATSAMVSTSLSEVGKTVHLLKDKCAQVGLFVGGGAVTESTTDYIVGKNAATYAHDAWQGFEKIHNFMEERRK